MGSGKREKPGTQRSSSNSRQMPPWQFLGLLQSLDCIGPKGSFFANCSPFIGLPLLQFLGFRKGRFLHLLAYLAKRAASDCHFWTREAVPCLIRLNGSEIDPSNAYVAT